MSTQQKTTVRLNRFRLLAYRSCKDTTLTSSNNVTALIGPNGAGKTNLMHGIGLLGVDRRPWHSQSSDDKELYARESQIEAQFSIGRANILYKSSIIYRPEQPRDEIAELHEQWNFPDIGDKSRWISTEEFMLGHLTARKEGIRSRSAILKHRDYLYQDYLFGRLHSRSFAKLRSLKSRRPLSEKAQSRFERIQEFRASIRYYSASQFTNPSNCPTSFDIDKDGDLRYSPAVPRRSPHTRFIYDLYRLSKDNAALYHAFMSIVDKEGLRLIDNVKWREVRFSSPAYEVRAGGHVVTKKETRTMIIPTVYVGESQLSFNQLSEGTLRSLAMLFYVVTDKSELVLIEGPEVCIHHGLLRSVIEIFKEYGRTKQIIFSTHSEAVVDYLEPEQILLVDKHPTLGTTVSSIPDSMSASNYTALKSYLSTSGNLGEYWRHRGFNA